MQNGTSLMITVMKQEVVKRRHTVSQGEYEESKVRRLGMDGAGQTRNAEKHGGDQLEISRLAHMSYIRKGRQV